MANLIVEGFDWFPTGQSTGTRDRLWGANNFFAISNGAGHVAADVITGRFGFGQALTFNLVTVASDSGYVIPIGATPSTGFIGCAMFRFPDTETGSGMAPAICFFDAVTGSAQISILFADNGVVKVRRGHPESGTLLANSAAGSFQEDEWFHVEVKALVANSGGTVEVRINTVPVISLTGADTQNTANAYFDSAAIWVSRPSSNALHYAIDDFFVNDTSGAQNNDWLGNVRVKTQFMIANGATDNFAIGGSLPAASHWQSVLNQLLDDTKYEYSSTIGDIDLFTPDPNLNSPLVHALQVRMGLRQDDATQRVARALLRIGSTVYPGSVDQYTNQTYTFYKERFALNPNTGVAFTGADLNGLQAGVKVQA